MLGGQVPTCPVLPGNTAISHAGRQKATLVTQNDRRNEATTKILTRFDVFKMYTNKCNNIKTTHKLLKNFFDYFGEDYNLSKSKEELMPILSTFITKSNIMYRKCHYTMNHFAKKHKDWLRKTIISGQLKVAGQLKLTPKSISFVNLSERQQLRSRRKLQTQMEQEPFIKKVRSFNESLSIDGVSLESKPAKDLESIYIHA